MIRIGCYNWLAVAQKTRDGFVLGQGPDAAFLHYTQATEPLAVGKEVRVFVYQSSDAMLQASMKAPRVMLGEFAQLRCLSVTDHGAFMDWGMPKDLFVPFAEQYRPMVDGQDYVVHVTWDRRGERLIGSSKLAPHFDYDIAGLERGDAVDLLVFSVTAASAQVVVDQRYLGMVYMDATSRRVHAGEELDGYVAKLREDNRVEITLSPPGAYREQRDEAQRVVLDELFAAGGFLPIHDKSSPADIHRAVGLSKKVFKRSVGSLYKARKVRLEADGIRLADDEPDGKAIDEPGDAT